ncbi:uncharacterized protein LOC120844346 [Ixodes scapularis]|uniref:uncharacterized protein LOC120844346 n=1 Tax=Ixodes scapularis TaxID=6945 RepID=UPI001C38D6D5|nr:uncharacterized protein LOC120844346 [Ixodes scapularis]
MTTRPNNNTNDTVALQWNCRGIKDKQGALQQYVSSLDPQPEIVALHETNRSPHLPGHAAYADPTEKSTAILIKGCIAAMQHLTTQKDCEHTLVEIISKSTKKKSNLFILNMYCRPSRKQPGIREVIREALFIAKDSPLLIVGDFNAPHRLWGYTHNSKKGKAIVESIEQEHLTLLNDPQTPTRTGTSVSRDTSPDLTLLAGTLDITWTNTQDSLGSDHDIIHILIKDKSYKAHIGSARITNWDNFRKDRNSQNLDQNLSYEELIQEALKDSETHTQTIATSYRTLYVDPNLLHLWEARHSLTRRWKRQRHKRKLKKRIALINKQAAEYAAVLCKEKWLQECDGLQDTLTTKKTWHLLRHLIDPLNSRGESNRNIMRTLNAYAGSSEELLKDLAKKYLPTGGVYSSPSYDGSPNQELDKDIQLYELREDSG